MRASLDTNVIIHLYKANMQSILFDMFKDGIFIYEQIRNVELENHGKSILDIVDADITAGKIEIYTDDKLKKQGVYRMFKNYVNENRSLYGAGDLGEVYAISLAQTVGTYSLITDDTKQGGPYMSLMQFEGDIKPFNFADILILRYLLGIADARQTVMDFDAINESSDLKWSLKSQLVKFIKRFMRDPYNEDDIVWFEQWTKKHGVDAIADFKTLRDVMR